jgi:hypothetical protein
MKARFLALLLLIPALAGTSIPARTSFVSLEEIRPGMTATGVTVFEGTRREEFTARILGVLENVIGPRRSLVLARLEGGPLEKTGVIAGMSGSPVYVDGRLLGAVSYSLGQLPKEPIAGITPIAEMIEATMNPAPRPPSPRAGLELPLTRDGMAAALRDVLSGPFADRASDVRTLSGRNLTELASDLRPIATPLALAGFSGDARDLLLSAFRDAGFAPVVAGASAGWGQGRETAGPADDAGAPLRPGDAVGVSLVSGDLALGATGTVTHVDGTRVYGFGHPFFNLGPVEFPMTRSYVHAIIPSLVSSIKVASTGDVVGAIRQDRATAIGGVLGPPPATVPLRITLESDRGQRHTFAMRLASDQLFTPLLAFASILSVLQSYEREFGAATFAITGEARVKGHGSIDLDDLFTGETASVNAATYVVTPVNLLLRNDVAPVEIEALDVSIRSAEEPRRATLERVWVDAVRVRAGRSVDLKVLTRSYRGEETLRTIPIAIPANASGTLSLLVSDGTRLAQWEQRETRRAVDAQNIPQMIRAFNSTRKNNRLYVRLISITPGAIVDGETLPALPPSVLAVYEADRSGGKFAPLRNAIVGSWDLPTDHAIVGSRLLTITIDAD